MVAEAMSTTYEPGHDAPRQGRLVLTVTQTTQSTVGPILSIKAIGGQFVGRLTSAPLEGSEGLEFICWNGEVVRIAFALDRHDPEVSGRVATNADISGERLSAAPSCNMCG